MVGCMLLVKGGGKLNSNGREARSCLHGDMSSFYSLLVQFPHFGLEIILEPSGILAIANIAIPKGKIS